MVELENHKAEFTGTDEDGNFVFKDNQTFDELKVKDSDIDDKMKAWLRGAHHLPIIATAPCVECASVVLTYAPCRGQRVPREALR